MYLDFQCEQMLNPGGLNQHMECMVACKDRKKKNNNLKILPLQN